MKFFVTLVQQLREYHGPSITKKELRAEWYAYYWSELMSREF